jgi:hypothetical protein
MMKTTSGSSFTATSVTETPTPPRTPRAWIAANTTKGPATSNARGAPSAAAGQRKVVASAKPFATEASVATRDSQVIQPTSNPANGPNASRV